ncbi:histidine kinase [Isoptericola sp. NEAU-Y5]|uniref:histidine kinase n=1 Tax=Isoptericola luteus TaxID=2879484 RepID=A0ABS7ZCH0_9MICO|nr:histidine kinase [Isoptericola sp. NEAU-Y5]MCA5891996.1 histidine kinase [Isoptericola sp. NEAU-Y5]
MSVDTAERRLRTLLETWGGDDRRGDVTTAVMLFLLGLLFLEVGLVDLFSGGVLGSVTPQPWWRVALLALGCALTLAKRTHPLTALAGGVAVTAVDITWGGSLAVLLVFWDLLYAAAMWTRPTARRWLWVTMLAVTVGVAVVAGEVERDVRAFVYTGLNIGAVLLVPMWWATNVRQKSELAALERDRADSAALAAQLERERAADLVRLGAAERHEAVQAERAAMARDLHDVIASHLSTIAIHSGAVLSSPPDTERDRAALTQVRQSAVASLSEMRSMIELLRADAPRDPLTAPGRLDRLDDLVGAARDAGVDVTVDDPDDMAKTALPAAAGQALHRIAQEALTNARKHAPGAPVHVRLARAGTGVLLEVRNASPSGARVPLAEPALSAGTGMVTMRERAEGLGGSLEAGLDDDGWVVRAHVPVPEVRP